MNNSNAIANLQMLMNTGDGRHAVLTELFQASESTESASFNTNLERRNVHAFTVTAQAHNLKLVSQEAQGSRVRLAPVFPPNNVQPPDYNLTDYIIQTLNSLSVEDKIPLVNFAEDLAYHYNNLFMAIVGYISIIVLNLKPGDPAYNQLHECEE
ncbi:MAG: hypothetical protein QNI89_13460, partial [Desulfobacterales bacterium]|nr:hypothetical protein [Desulfobacterales bacterium]